MDQRNLASGPAQCGLQSQNKGSEWELKNGGRFFSSWAKLQTHACIHLATQLHRFALN